ncbi:hypothetical protein [Phenylobacterium sp.]|uniref:hypothetical protein n=1 Tax=Phenylobacterium sp. TaxID=1871053 RepID=UPI0035B33AEC
MPTDASAPDRHSAILAELAGMTLALARDLQNRALEAERVEDAVKLSGAFQRVSRGLRQTLALELKVIRERDAAAREARDSAERAALQAEADARLRQQSVARRCAAIRDRVDNAFWSEQENGDWDEDDERARRRPPSDPVWRRLEAFLDEAAQRPDFLADDFDILVIEACDTIGVDATLLYDIVDNGPPAPSGRPDVAGPCAEPQAADSS